MVCCGIDARGSKSGMFNYDDFAIHRIRAAGVWSLVRPEEEAEEGEDQEEKEWQERKEKSKLKRRGRGGRGKEGQET